MRFLCLTVILLAGFTVSSRANEGVIVNKVCRPRADSTMVGTEGVYSFVFRGPVGTSRLPITVPSAEYWSWEREKSESCKFLLRDPQGNVCSHLVPSAVFVQYETGDHFNGCDPAGSRGRLEEDNKSVHPITVHRYHAQHGQRGSRTAHHCRAQRTRGMASRHGKHRAAKTAAVSRAGHRSKA